MCSVVRRHTTTHMGKPFNVVLTEQHRDMLEAIRRHDGLKSEGDVIRMLIEGRASSGLPTPERRAEMKAAVRQVQVLARTAVRGDPGDMSFGPVPSKPGSRLEAAQGAQGVSEIDLLKPRLGSGPTAIDRLAEAWQRAYGDPSNWAPVLAGKVVEYDPRVLEYAPSFRRCASRVRTQCKRSASIAARLPGKTRSEIGERSISHAAATSS